jgi:hypothetical protein
VATVVINTQGLGGTTPSGSLATPITTTYLDFNYHQDVTGAVASATSSIVDNGIGNPGSVTFGATGATQTSVFTPLSNGGYSWGGLISQGAGFNSNYADTNVPAFAQLCQVVPNHNGTYQKSVDVLVESSALPITTAAGLAGIRFRQYFEDCSNSTFLTNNNVVATGTATQFIFDSSGNLSGAFTADANFVNALLNGNATIPANSTSSYAGGIVSFNAFKFTTASGLVKYALVIHGAPTSTGLATSGNGFTGVWTTP